MCPVYPRPKTLEETLIDVILSDEMALIWSRSKQSRIEAEQRRQDEMDWLDWVGA